MTQPANPFVDEGRADKGRADKASHDQIRRAIQFERSRVGSQISTLHESFTGIVEAAELTSTDDEHDPEGATIAYERAQVSALLAQARSDLAELDAALVRLADGTIRTCAACGGPIALERILALPHVRTCIHCAR